MNRKSAHAICLKCKTKPIISPNPSSGFSCSNCNQTYPRIAGKVPILLEQPRKYIARWYWQYEQYLRQQQSRIDKIANSMNGDRPATLTRMQHAIRQNMSYLSFVQKQLLDYVDIETLTETIHGRDFIPYITSWEYLRRDWCWLPEGEEELKVIKDALFETIGRCSTDVDSVLVVGAGTGRIAWDLCGLFEQVHALDKSLTMAYQFHDLLEDDIVFYELNKNNIYEEIDAVRELRATLSQHHGKGSDPNNYKEKIFYYVGDALNIALPDQSLSVIVSVYFTDLVPLKPFIQEIKRVLKSGGIFIHFGPLEYDLVDVNDCLSASAIKSIFLSNNFTICTDARLRTSHLLSTLSMVSKSYNNWVFAAAKKG